MFNTENLTTFLNGVRRATNAVHTDIDTPKVEWIIDHISESVKQKKKTLVYSTWIQNGMGLVQDRLDTKGIPWVEVNGKMSQRARTIAINKYNRNQVYVIFISSAGSEGLDLKETRSVIAMEPHWNNEKLRQVIGRAVRYKSHSTLPEEKRHVDIYIFMQMTNFLNAHPGGARVILPLLGRDASEPFHRHHTASTVLAKYSKTLLVGRLEGSSPETPEDPTLDVYGTTAPYCEPNWYQG